MAASKSYLFGGGQLGELIRTRDWQNTQLGPIEAWPQSLLTSINLIINSGQPMFIAWGPELTFIYNDGYAPILGARHPRALGQPFQQVWPEIWDDLAKLIDAALAGQSTWVENLHLVMERNGAKEDTWYTFSYSPIYDETGQTRGMLCSCMETTQQVYGARFTEFRLELEQRLRHTADPQDAMVAAAELLGKQLSVARVGYGDIDPSGEFVVVERDWSDGTIGSVAGTHRMEAFGPAIIAELRANRVMTVADVAADERVGEGAAAFAAIGTRSVLAVPLFRNGEFRAMLYLHHSAPKNWSPEDQAFSTEVLERTWDTVERARAEKRLRESEERHRFLDELGQMTAESLNADEVLAITTRMVAQHMGVSNCAYADMDEDEDGFTIRGDWAAPGSPSIVGHYSLADFGQLAVTNLKAGKPLIINNNLVEIAPHEAATFQSIGITATICMPLVKDGRLTALMAVHDKHARHWTEDELALIQEVTQRSWAHIERVGAFAGLRESEQRFRLLAEQQKDTAQQLAALNSNLEKLVDERTADLMAAEESLRQSQKMEAVGQLTGGIAHDFNNILAGIGGSLEMMSTRLAQGRTGDIQRYVTGASSAVRRGAGLTQRLLAFSRRQTLDPKPTNLNQLVAGMIELINRSVGPEIAVTATGDETLWTTLVDAGQLENALLNLCINARDAMPDGGSLSIESRNCVLSARQARRFNLSAGKYVCLSVTDTGTGMTPEVLARAFDPFFTTKPIGQGTGLGLSMVYGFAGQSGGAVHVDSELGRGTQVSIYLPRREGELDAQDNDAQLESEAPRAHGSEIVLLVDDEPLVRLIASEQLEELGYKVLEAPDAASALKVLDEAARVDLLVTDVGLPGGMNGRQLADAA
ncbi:MAG TPA: GAF domain-containing protein, partial [Devosia sp.]